MLTNSDRRGEVRMSHFFLQVYHNTKLKGEKTPIIIYMYVSAECQQSGAVGVCWAHNPEGSKPCTCNIIIMMPQGNINI